MRAFLQCRASDIGLEPCNYNIFNAYCGLRDMGFECIRFSSLQDLEDYYHHKDEIIVGGVGMIRKRLKTFDIEPPIVDYPTELSEYLDRVITKDKLSHIVNDHELWPIFIKSVDQKVLTGKVITSTKDLVGLGFQDNDIDIYRSPVVDFKSEYRVFVRYGQILDVKHYWGNPLVFPDSKVIQRAIGDYTSAPDAYGIDFGVTSDGKTLLIEVNDAWALGCYGLESHLYAKFLLTRWAQLTNTPDQFFYI